MTFIVILNNIFITYMKKDIIKKYCQVSKHKKILCITECDICFYNSFASNPKSISWSDKNEISPRNIHKSSSLSFWFKCDKSNHEFKSRLYSITQGRWCPYPCCGSSTKLCSDNSCIICFNASFASNNRSKNLSDKNKINPREIFKNTHKKYLFKCDKSDHEFYSSPNLVETGRWCPYPCCGSNTKLCSNNSCLICFNSSFASVNRSKNLSDKIKINPREIFKNTHKKYLFKCDKSNHEFFSTIFNVTQNYWCPYPCCSNPSRKLCEDNSCMICFNSSFASSEFSIYWSDKNGKINPREIFKNTNSKFWFKCDKSDHEFLKDPHVITRTNVLCVYPCCSNYIRNLCSSINCKICFEFSMASHENSKFLLNKNLNPRDIAKNNELNLEFLCEKNHNYIGNIKNNFSCTRCNYFRNESECIKYIELLTGEIFYKQRPKFLNGKEFDGYSEKLKLAIEYNGEQHYEFVNFFHKNGVIDLEKQQKDDRIKIQLCHNNGIYLIVIPYWIKYTKNWKNFIDQEYENYLFLRNSFF
jgi:hypothetical protein